MHILGIGTANPPARYTKAECLAAFEKSAWFARLDGRAHFIARTVLQRDNGIEARRLAVDSLDMLLAAAAARSDRFFACEPRRSWLALAGSHLVGAIGANAVTREDAVLSVRAGFQRDEISGRWPRADGHWQMQEYAAGLFSHCFSARRTGVAG